MKALKTIKENLAKIFCDAPNTRMHCMVDAAMTNVHDVLHDLVMSGTPIDAVRFNFTDPLNGEFIYAVNDLRFLDVPRWHCPHKDEIRINGWRIANILNRAMQLGIPPRLYHFVFNEYGDFRCFGPNMGEQQ